MRTISSRDFSFTKAVGSDATWSLLGNIVGDGTAKQTVLDMSGFVSKDIMIRFTSHGAQTIPPEIDRFEIEYMPIGQKYRAYTAQVVSVDGIDLLDMTKENSGAFIQATLFSCAESQKRFIVAFPAPGPVGHTAYVQISIADPGAQFPMLAYKDEAGNALDVIGTSIPVQFDVL